MPAQCIDLVSIPTGLPCDTGSLLGLRQLSEGAEGSSLRSFRVGDDVHPYCCSTLLAWILSDSLLGTGIADQALRRGKGGDQAWPPHGWRRQRSPPHTYLSQVAKSIASSGTIFAQPAVILQPNSATGQLRQYQPLDQSYLPGVHRSTARLSCRGTSSSYSRPWHSCVGASLCGVARLYSGRTSSYYLVVPRLSAVQQRMPGDYWREKAH
ncbi:hypothetical protein L226DRAFT_328986 [Lentinus tigrinus ALCF2SS1-7]|uniref:Uncharacterized protein n=1 Tax=Lentinus tigrinus ALCF2SS1-6 TaxID=1328759 RepID=A0A5C2SFL7_9APHY|nr:hypothetical protein L227DRAFT_429444 [Lentinus tigrinus ALCF2SS1-6]RPD77680.1 hypothetical protein L226DRAFT_328986 [Lentinus tigrinus ALCF2SS1-7]